MARLMLGLLLAMAGTIVEAATTEAPATAAYKQAMDTMMAQMNQPFSGNPDRDFVTGMIPHHQGAIDMADIELRYGHDHALRRLARDIIGSQKNEQAFMRRWLQQHPAH